MKRLKSALEMPQFELPYEVRCALLAIASVGWLAAMYVALTT